MTFWITYIFFFIWTIGNSFVSFLLHRRFKSIQKLKEETLENYRQQYETYIAQANAEIAREYHKLNEELKRNNKSIYN